LVVARVTKASLSDGLCKAAEDLVAIVWGEIVEEWVGFEPDAEEVFEPPLPCPGLVGVGAPGDCVL